MQVERKSQHTESPPLISPFDHSNSPIPQPFFTLWTPPLFQHQFPQQIDFQSPKIPDPKPQVIDARPSNLDPESFYLDRS
jgi:hypothetical protein